MKLFINNEQLPNVKCIQSYDMKNKGTSLYISFYTITSFNKALDILMNMTINHNLIMNNIRFNPDRKEISIPIYKIKDININIK